MTPSSLETPPQVHLQGFVPSGANVRNAGASGNNVHHADAKVNHGGRPGKRMTRQFALPGQDVCPSQVAPAGQHHSASRRATAATEDNTGSLG